MLIVLLLYRAVTKTIVAARKDLAPTVGKAPKISSVTATVTTVEVAATTTGMVEDGAGTEALIGTKIVVVVEEVAEVNAVAVVVVDMEAAEEVEDTEAAADTEVEVDTRIYPYLECCFWFPVISTMMQV